MADDFSTWIEPGRMMASQRAMSLADMARWSDAGITMIVNLDTQVDDQNALRALNLDSLHFPVPDFTAPDLSLIVLAQEVIDEELGRGGVVCVHCRAGLGRTGTLVASWLVSTGLTADEAIARVRSLRPGSVETSEQEEAVQKYAELLNDRRNDQPRS